jgi:hypothetical protein
MLYFYHVTFGNTYQFHPLKYYGIVTLVLTIRHVFVKAGMALLKGYTFPAISHRYIILNDLYRKGKPAARRGRKVMDLPA